MDGDHSIEVSAEITQKVLAAQFKALADHHVLLEGALLKPNFVRTGMENKNPASMKEVAKWTLKVLQSTVPPALPGINFLSGGMSEIDATNALNELNVLANAAGKKAPWCLSFSYGRALQQSTLAAWKGKDENQENAQGALLIRAQANSLAQLGKYTGEKHAVSEAAKKSTYVKNYSY